MNGAQPPQIPTIQEDDFRDLYEHAPFGYVSTSGDWSIVRANRTFAELTGYDADELAGRPFPDLLTVGGRIYHETHYGPLLRLQGWVREVAAQVLRADGTTVPVLLASVLRRGNHPDHDVVRTTVMAAPDRHRFEVELRRARRRAERSERRVGLVHRVVAATTVAVTVSEMMAALRDAMREAGSAEVSLWLRQDGGTLAPVGGTVGEPIAASAAHPVARAFRSGKVLTDLDSQMLAVRVGDGSDLAGVLTVRPTATDSIVDMDDLELVATLGREVGQVLERVRLYEHKDWLLGVAAHDLKTPLTSISGYAEMLQTMLGAHLPEREGGMLGRIVTNSARMAALIDDVLELSASESGRIELAPSSGDLVELVAASASEHKPIAASKGLTIVLERGATDGTAVFDAARLRRVVDNLLSNAVKYSQPGATVRVRVVDEGVALGVHVEDEGQGIPADDLPNIFVPFGRTSPRPTGGEPSTGLGLSIAKRIIEAHDGVIEVDSELGVGSTFRFSIPRRGTGPDRSES